MATIELKKCTNCLLTRYADSTVPISGRKCLNTQRLTQMSPLNRFDNNTAGNNAQIVRVDICDNQRLYKPGE